MASINYAAREISVKIVYYGPGLSGKTTNLQVIHRKVPQEYKSDMVSLATETDRTLFFDFLPLDLGKIKGFSTKFQLYTVPGQVYYNATRKLVLRGVDGVVFVADSAPDKVQENLESFQNLEENLAEYGYKRENVPIIIQYNKRDLPNAMTVEELQQLVNKYNLPWSEAVANKGKGVFDSLKLIGKIVIDYLNKKYSRGSSPRAPEASLPSQPEVKRAYGQNPIPPQQQQFQGGNFNAYQMPPQGQMPSFQQQRPAMPPAQQRPMQQQPPMNMGSQQGRMPPQMNQGMPPQQNPAFFQQKQQLRTPPQQQQNFGQGAPMQQNFGNSFNPNQFIPPVQNQPQFPAQNQFEPETFEEAPSFEQPPQANAPQSDYFDYGAVNLESMSPAPQQQMPQQEDDAEMFLEQPAQGGFAPPPNLNLPILHVVENSFLILAKPILILKLKNISARLKKSRNVVAHRVLHSSLRLLNSHQEQHSFSSHLSSSNNFNKVANLVGQLQKTTMMFTTWKYRHFNPPSSLQFSVSRLRLRMKVMILCSLHQLIQIVKNVHPLTRNQL